MTSNPVAGRAAGNARSMERSSEARERPAEKADKADAEKFDALVRHGDKQPQQPGILPEQEGTGMAGLFGQAVSSMLGQVQGQEQSVAAPVATTAAQAPDMLTNSRCDELVDRILVSQPAADGTTEVRIKLDAAWLPDTEIRLVKTPDAGLSVEFMTDDVDSQRFLLPNLSELRGRLSERTGGEVAVRMSEQSAPGGGDQPGDGRSRNRRNLYEEIGERR